MLKTIVIALLTGAVGAASQAPPVAPAGNVENGKKLFTTYYCYACHGYAAQGGRAGPRIGPRPIAYPAFVRYLRQPTGLMPLYTGKVMSDQEVADVHAFLRSLPAPPPFKSIPLLN